MPVYLQDIPLPEAHARFEQALKEAGRWVRMDAEEIELDENAVGRVTAEAVFARISSPHYHAAAMDGFAVSASQTAGALPSQPVTIAVEDRGAVYVDTGDPLPGWADTVVPIENIEPLDMQGELTGDMRRPAAIRLRAPQPPWLHVRPMGEDIVTSQLVMPAGQSIRPVDLGVLAAGGYARVRVVRKPRVAILPTGSELVPAGSELQPGDIIEYNSLMLAGQVKEWGGEPHRFPISTDDFDEIAGRVRQAAEESDLVLINAGSSAGSEDFTSRVVTELGTLLVHGVAVRPGHPVILGLIRSGRGDVPVIGIPGYPVSAALTGEIFVEPLLAHWLGKEPAVLPEMEAQLTRKVASTAGDDDYLRVVLGKVGERWLAAPLARGAGVLTSLAKADGITILPRGVQGQEAGSTVRVRLYRSVHELAKTIFAIGSHDMTLDILATFLAERGRRLVSANVGSQGGLVAIRRKEAHLAGSHLLDPETGEYNLAAVRQYLPDTPVKIITWAGREQGLMVKKGNPKEITSLADLKREDVSMVNRQRGAGTRVLLDYHFRQESIDPQDVQGYDLEEYTHLGVAAAVASGRADTGLGIPAAAMALDLDFVPLYQERYDLVIPCWALEGDLLQPIFDLMQDKRFRQAVSAMPGYDLSQMGRIVLDCDSSPRS